MCKWAHKVKPKLIIIENVKEFQGWGPLDDNGEPIVARMGETFRRWRRRLEGMGYIVDFRVLDASLYGAPTRRRRLFLVARCDMQPVRWPAPTHGKGLLPIRTAAECIDWSLPVKSIFGREKPEGDGGDVRPPVAVEGHEGHVAIVDDRLDADPADSPDVALVNPAGRSLATEPELAKLDDGRTAVRPHVHHFPPCGAPREIRGGGARHARGVPHSA